MNLKHMSVSQWKKNLEKGDYFINITKSNKTKTTTLKIDTPLTFMIKFPRCDSPIIIKVMIL